MSTKVDLVITGAYAMPPVCVSCGTLAGSETAAAGGSDRSGKNLVSLPFPICDDCAAARRAIKRPRRRGHLLGLLAGLVLGIVVGNIGSLVVESDAWAITGIAIFPLGFVLGGRLALRRVPAETRTRAAALDRAATFKRYQSKTFGDSTAVIEFPNDSFARMFCTANPLVAAIKGGGGQSATAPGAQSSPPGWYQDPTGRHERRFWDGSNWSENVSDRGVTGVDVFV
ncbi:MAG TPA: DUF2510 domain-containing protein [Actinomycetota bacterium]|nr:DUF2510 domain-containing protein [Actinomycetota bacterium]